MTPRPWHLDPDTHGGGWLLAADTTPVCYVADSADALFILAAVRFWDTFEAPTGTIGNELMQALAQWQERQHPPEESRT